MKKLQKSVAFLVLTHYYGIFYKLIISGGD